MTPDELLVEARGLLEDTSTGTVSIWARAAALLTRQALEDALDELWSRRAPSLRHVNMRAQLNCLGAYLQPPDLERDVAFTWHALSRAIHHRPYELDPTREELDSLIAGTQRLADAVRDGRPRPTVAGVT